MGRLGGVGGFEESRIRSEIIMGWEVGLWGRAASAFEHTFYSSEKQTILAHVSQAK